MSLSLQEFVRRLTDSSLVAPDQIEAALTKAAADREGDDAAEHLARELVRSAKLTPFQAQQIFSGNEKSLVLGNYVILEKLGQGGMGVVLKAEHRRMKRLVALKILSPAVMQTADAVKRFQREVEAAAKLIHPNIVTAFDADEANGTHFLVMEFVPGRDLAAISAAGPMPVEIALDFIRQAAKGLAFAHQHGIVHRDIKPANLLVDPSGTVKILDLGLARIDGLRKEDAHEGLTQSGQVMGTVDFMAPEQAFDVRSADGRADIYSLGCTLFRLLTNANLYDGESLVQKLMAHQTGNLPSLLDRRPDVPPTVDALTRRMIAKKPDQRFQSMHEVIAAIDELLGQRPQTEISASTFSAVIGGLGIAANPDTVTRLHSAPFVPATSMESAATLAFANPIQGTDPVPEHSITAARSTATAATVKTPPARLQIGWMLLSVGGLILAIVICWALRQSDSVVQVNEDLAAPAPVPVSISIGELLTSPDYEWSEPINLGKGVNTATRELKATLSEDELLIVFTRGVDLWLSTRSTRDEPFAQAERLPPPFNQNTRCDSQGAISGDGLTLAFVSDRAGASLEDIWMAERNSRTEPFGPPRRLPEPINSSSTDRGVVFSSDGLTMLLNSDRPLRKGNADILQFYRLSPAANFEPVPLLGPVNNALWDVASWISADRLVLVKSGAEKSNSDSQVFVRTSTSEPFSPGIPLGPPFVGNGPMQPHLSRDGQRAYFHSRNHGGEGDLDLWMVHRVRKN